MLSAIELDHKFRFETCKIRDIAADRHLPAESVTAELPTPQMLPKVAFSICGLISQSAATTLCDKVTHATDYPAFCPLPTGPLAQKSGLSPALRAREGEISAAVQARCRGRSCAFPGIDR